MNSTLTFSKKFKEKNLKSNFFRPDITSFSILAMFVGAAVKSGISEDFETISYTGWIFIFREIGGYIGVFGLILFLFQCKRNLKFITPSISSPIFWLLLFKFTIFARFIFDTSTAIKYGASLITTIILWILISSRNRKQDWDKFNSLIIKGVVYFSFLMITINLYLYIFFEDATSWKGRFLGIFHHPNFLGVNMAIFFAIFLMSSMLINKKGDEKIKFILILIGIIISFFLAITSGSRTATLGIIASLCSYLISRKILNPLGLFSLLFIFIFLYIFNEFYINYIINIIPALNRITGNDNTRDEVFKIMLNSFLLNPFFGAGENAGATASSYLRAVAIGGVFSGISLLLAVFFSIKKAIKINSKNDPKWIIPLSAVIICAITEGFLVDALSFGSYIFIFITILISLRNNKLYYK